MNAMRWLFSFKGRIGRVPFALSALAILVVQYLAIGGAVAFVARMNPLDPVTYLVPLYAFSQLSGVSHFVFLGGLACIVVASWMLAALAFRRATDAGLTEWPFATVIVPVVQILIVMFLSFAPSRLALDANDNEARPTWAAAAQGVLAAMALTVLSVALGALIFGVYGYGMFVASPFLIGMTTAFIANRKHDISAGQSIQIVLLGAVLGGLTLMVFALEGALCIVMASPIGIVVALAGGFLGRAVARSTRRSAKSTLYSLALLPIVFAAERTLPTTTTFDSYQTISIAAPADAVWQSLLHVTTMDEPLSFPFQLGLAYPIRGDVLGEGVGAPCRAEFSTGTAYERVTEWVPNRKFAFTVVREIPSMRELSPYRHVHAPHVQGYFRTLSVSFDILPQADGSTTVVERTRHEIKLEPVLYWLPIARWVMAETNDRVLDHLRNQAQRMAASPS
jgi:uncharacterized membrane protein YhaH (DUF805 family)